MAEKPSLISRVKALGTLEALAAEPEYKNILRNVYPLTGKAGTERKTKSTLGEGSFGRVNLEELEEGNVATKYFLEPIGTFDENIAEIAALKYIQGLPNVAQLIHVDPRPASLAVNAIAPSIAADLRFPAIVMGKAIGTLEDRSLYKSWEDVFSTIRQILRGYYTLHLNGIVHRDTKPANMLMTATREVWISDFGASRYTDSHIPTTLDRYTGTYWYASPEILMNNSVNDGVDNFIKSDTWAVGASCLDILCGGALFKGSTPHKMLNSIFSIIGTPDASDGRTYELYTMYIIRNPLPTYPKQPADAIVKYIQQNAVYKPADLTVLDKVAIMISGFLKLDPVKRITSGMALISPPLSEKLPGIASRQNISSTYVGDIAISNDITVDMCDMVLEWVYDIVTRERISPFSQDSSRIILDRAGAFFFQFLQQYKENPFMKKENLQLISGTSLLLAASLFDKSSSTFLSPRDIVYLAANSFKEKDVLECVKMFMVADIKFYGRTLYDSIITVSSYGYTPAQLDTIALLNFACYQKNLFGPYKEDLRTLRQKIIQFATGKLTFKEYLKRPTAFRIRTGAKTASQIVEFIAFMKKMDGGGKKKTRKHKLKRRKTYKSSNKGMSSMK